MGAESELCLGLEATGLGREGAGAAGDVCEPRRRHTREAKKAATPSKAASALLPSLPRELGRGERGSRERCLFQTLRCSRQAGLTDRPALKRLGRGNGEPREFGVSCIVPGAAA